MGGAEYGTGIGGIETGRAGISYNIFKFLVSSYWK
jgi:hypothetical protein